MAENKRNRALLILIYLFLAAALFTLLPGNTSKPNDLGYFSQCSFAPWSSLTLALCAGVVWVIRQYFLTRPKPE
jgi:hypothetical protein